jgi:hypothetical protein
MPRCYKSGKPTGGEPPGRPSPVRDAGDEARDEEDEAVLALARRAAAEHQGQLSGTSRANRLSGFANLVGNRCT